MLTAPWNIVGIHFKKRRNLIQITVFKVRVSKTIIHVYSSAKYIWDENSAAP